MTAEPAGALGGRVSPLKAYRFPLILLAGIAVGCAVGLAMGPRAVVLKPIGDLFLNLLFMIVTPLVFFSIASAVAAMASGKRLGRILGAMLLTFIFTGIVASLLMLGALSFFDPLGGAKITLTMPEAQEAKPLEQLLVQTFTVSNFGDLLSRKNMLPLIIFAVLVGLAATRAGEAGRAVGRGMLNISLVMEKLVGFVMLLAPVGLGAYFAALVGEFGPQLLGTYARAMAVYYPMAIVYFFGAFTVYAAMSAGGLGVRRFWKEIPGAAITALATGSSVAAIPANLEAAKQIGVPRDVRELVVPIGATIHMDGSCLSAILKIVFLFALFGQEFGGGADWAIAVGVALLSGTVMAGIPGGGFIGEMLIVSLYGFPPEALPVLAVIGTLVDPPATMVNSAGDTVCSMMSARLLDGRGWIGRGEGAAE